jgi:hypothetical protein
VSIVVNIQTKVSKKMPCAFYQDGSVEKAGKKNPYRRLAGKDYPFSQ